MRAMSAAQTGADALVPPFGCDSPRKINSYRGSPAKADTSGTIRPLILPLLSELTLTFCHAGLSNFMLTPPPVEPPPLLVRLPGASHQTTSFTDPPDWVNIVPPTLSTNGLEPGKSTWALPSSSWSPEPSSPEETQIVM